LLHILVVLDIAHVFFRQDMQQEGKQEDGQGDPCREIAYQDVEGINEYRKYDPDFGIPEMRRSILFMGMLLPPGIDEHQQVDGLGDDQYDTIKNDIGFLLFINPDQGNAIGYQTYGHQEKIFSQLLIRSVQWMIW
jgi:hypothetical protein